MKKILIMGLPGSGKTTLAQQIVHCLELWDRSYLWLNADAIRSQYNDWDFSQEGRLRQAQRMKDLAANALVEFVIADFVAPLAEMRKTFQPDFIIWMDTISSSRYADTNACFEPPTVYNIRVKTKSAKVTAPRILWKYFS